MPTVRLPGIITRNFRLKAMSCGLALVMWTVVVYAGNPPDSRTVSVDVPFGQAAGGTPFVLAQPLAPVAVRVTGTHEHVTAFDPASSLTVTVDVRGIIRPGLQDVPIMVANSDRDVDLDNPPTSVQADVDIQDTRQVPVVAVINPGPPPGYQPRAPVVDPDHVLVTAPSRILKHVVARVSIDLHNYKSNYNASPAVELRTDNGTTLPRDVSATPSTVKVAVIVDSSLTSRTVPVHVEVQGTVAPGHQLGALAVSPQTVVISGPQTVINTVDFVTVSVSVQGLFGSATIGGVTVDTGHVGVVAQPGKVDVHVALVAVPQATPTPTATAPATPTAAPPTP